MHNNTAINKITGESIPCLKDGDKLYHYAGEDSEPVELGDQWHIQKESILIPAIFVLIMISGLALLLWRATNFSGYVSIMSNVSPEVIELKPCPFCGAPAGIKSEHERFQIVGCMTRAAETMLCPSPTITVYRKEDGSFNYNFWNRRV